MEATFFSRHPFARDALNIIIFLVCVIVGTLLINTYVFRSYSVVGPSMQNTLETGDRLIVNRIPVTIAQLQNKPYQPARGQIIVFKNPLYTPGAPDEFIVKRVIAFGGEHIVLKDGHYTVYNKQHPNGFNPDDATPNGPQSPTSGTIDEVVPAGTIFVSGDHRQASFSLDSRNGLGPIPLYDVIGPVDMRIFPFNRLRTF